MKHNKSVSHLKIYLYVKVWNSDRDIESCEISEIYQNQLMFND